MDESASCWGQPSLQPAGGSQTADGPKPDGNQMLTQLPPKW